jgi:site-specific DNA-cytosine methylase
LFGGEGGSSYGARNAGFDVVAGFDNWGPAVKSLSEKFSKS